MSDPKRWSSAGSEVDPVVRALMSHAKSRAPSEVSVNRLVLGVEAALAGAAVGPSPWRRRVRAVGGALVGVALGGLAWAGAGRLITRLEPAAPVGSTLSVPGSATSERVRQPPASGVVTPPVSPLPAPPASASASVPPLRGVSRAPTGQSAADEVSSLIATRKLLGEDPARALAMTETFARENPQSAYGEERAAIAIEALERLERWPEAERRLEQFERSFPESPYRRRLRAGLLRAAGH